MRQQLIFEELETQSIPASKEQMQRNRFILGHIFGVVGGLTLTIIIFNLGA